MSSRHQKRVSSLPLVAIVGRPNVGKSSLFNRVTGERRAIVTNEPGITRDRLYGVATWLDKAFEVVDTGGLVPDEKATMAQEILRQARVAVDAATTLVLVVDTRAGVTPLDAELARLMLRTGKPVVLAANKVDTGRLMSAALPFHELGISSVVPVSAEHGLGVAELLDVLTEELQASAASPAEVTLNVALIGRPNVGKSTLLNRLAGKERTIVAAEPGTTRDAVDMLVRSDGAWWRLVDTAGIRRKARTDLLAEKLSVVMARKHLERADIAVLLLDATKGVTRQDATIGSYAHDTGRSIILAMNKWDLVEKDAHTMEAWDRAVRQRLKFLDYAPLVFISALNGQRITRLKKLITEVGIERNKMVAADELKEFLAALPLERATVPRGHRMQLKMIKQVAAAPPLFEIRANLPKLYSSLQGFLENQLRERFGFAGTPIRLRLVRGRGRRRGSSRPPRRRRRAT